MRAVRVRVRAFVLIYVTLRFSCVVFLHCVWLVFTSIGGRLCTCLLYTSDAADDIALV